MAGRKAGRPSSYTPEVADQICEHIAAGKSLVSWCKADGRPSYSMVARWLDENDEFREKYARAREAQADFLAEEIVEIADEREVTVGEDQVVFDSTAVARNRLRMDARKWYAAKLAPKKYGEKLDVNQTVNLTRTSYTDAALEEVIARGSGKGIAGSAEGEGQP